MDLAGLTAKITFCTATIDMGRRCFMIDGREHEGRLFYEKGLAAASECFHAALATADPEVLIRADHTYSEQELHFCDPADKDARNSLATAIRQFDDALRCYEAVQDPGGYRAADKTYQRDGDYRVQGCPLDAFHQACKAHTTRLRNLLRAPGINMTEKGILNQRIANMNAAQTAYLKLQTAALSAPPATRRS